MENNLDKTEIRNFIIHKLKEKGHLSENELFEILSQEEYWLDELEVQKLISKMVNENKIKMDEGYILLSDEEFKKIEITSKKIVKPENYKLLIIRGNIFFPSRGKRIDYPKIVEELKKYQIYNKDTLFGSIDAKINNDCLVVEYNFYEIKTKMYLDRFDFRIESLLCVPIKNILVHESKLKTENDIIAFSGIWFLLRIFTKLLEEQFGQVAITVSQYDIYDD